MQLPSSSQHSAFEEQKKDYKNIMKDTTTSATFLISTFPLDCAHVIFFLQCWLLRSATIINKWTEAGSEREIKLLKVQKDGIFCKYYLGKKTDVEWNVLRKLFQILSFFVFCLEAKNLSKKHVRKSMNVLHFEMDIWTNDNDGKTEP